MDIWIGVVQYKFSKRYNFTGIHPFIVHRIYRQPIGKLFRVLHTNMLWNDNAGDMLNKKQKMPGGMLKNGRLLS